MNYIMTKEILPAYGCTEPIAVAYAAAAAAKNADGQIEQIQCEVSGNIIKNVASVIIPGTNGLYGMKAAIAAGVVARTPELKLEVLSSLDESKLPNLNELLAKNIITVKPAMNSKSLYIKLKINTNNGCCVVLIEDVHDNIVFIEKNGKTIFLNSTIDPNIKDMSDNIDDEKGFTLNDLHKYVKNTPLEDFDIIKDAIAMNKRICEEGLKNNYGLGVGKFLKESNFSKYFTESALEHVLSLTVAGTDARMAGSSLPAMSNSGSGNQGIATTMPVVGFGEYLDINEEKLIRAVALSNLVTIFLKSKLGRLSSLCGVVPASAGASCGIVYLLDGNLEVLENSIKNVMGNIAGMFCDGAKAGCSLKVATGTFTALLSAHKALEGNSIKGTDGIVENTVEKTLENYAKIANEGTNALDQILLEIMLKK